MTLFASLAKTEAFAEMQNMMTSSKHSPAFPTTAVQLYTSRYIHFLNNSIISTKDESYENGKMESKFRPKKYEQLTYQAIQVPDASIVVGRNSTTNTSSSINNQKENHLTDHSKPNLGIWNCQMNSDSVSNIAERTAKILQGVLRGSNPTFLLVLDLDDPCTVYPQLTSMVESIIGYSSHRDHSNGLIPNIGTTPLSKLKYVSFGKAPLSQEDSNKEPVDSSQTLTHILPLNIIICGVLSKYTSKDATYKDKQAMNFLSYHLQKYASELNCSLCFVNSGKDGDDNQEGQDDLETSLGENVEVRNDTLRPNGMSVFEFSKLLKRICQGQYSMSDEEANIGKKEDNMLLNEYSVSEMHDDAANIGKPTIYFPHQYDADLINSVLLRGAGCPGVWNANTDDLWIALPPASSKEIVPSTHNVSSHKEQCNHGDVEWLNKLSESVQVYLGMGGTSDAASVLSPEPSVDSGTPKVTKKKVVKKKPTGEKVDVQDFFASLISK